jgi:hypothetical protein
VNRASTSGGRLCLHVISHAFWVATFHGQRKEPVGVALDFARILNPAGAAYPYSSPSSTRTSTILELCERGAYQAQCVGVLKK